MVAKVLSWLKGREYQWGREDFHKVGNCLYWSVIGIAGGLILTLAPLSYFKVGEVWSISVVVTGTALFCLAYGGFLALRWADERLKKLPLGSGDEG